jgi:hypothetical protein
VDELASDRYGAYSPQPVEDPTGHSEEQRRGYRGFGWVLFRSQACRIFERRGRSPTANEKHAYGLRVALSPQED